MKFQAVIRSLLLLSCPLFLLGQIVQQGGNGGSGGGGGGGYSTVSTAYVVGTYYFPSGGGGLGASATRTAVQTMQGGGGAISQFGVTLGAPPGSGVTTTFTWFDGATGEPVTCAVTGTVATTCADATHTFSYAQGDFLSVQMVVAGGTFTGSVSFTAGTGATGATGATGPPGPAPPGTGIVKVTGGTPGLAVAGTDYQAPITSGTNLQYLKGDLTLGTLSTLLVPENTNLYFTNARAIAALSGLYQSPIVTGTALQYFRGDLSLQTLNTLNVPELTNLYFTNARAVAAMSGLYEAPLTFSAPIARSVNTISLNLWGSGSRPVAANALGTAGVCVEWGATGLVNAASGLACGAGGGSGANTALSNLAAVSINTSLIPQTGVDLGSASAPFRFLYLYGGGSFGANAYQFTGTATAARTFTLPDANSNPVVGIANPSDTNVVNYVSADGVQHRIAQTGGTGGTGNAGSVVTTTFSATPTFTCPSASAGTVTLFKLSTAMSASITSSTLASCTGGAGLGQLIIFDIQQAASGGPFTWAPPGGFDNSAISPTASAHTKLVYSWDGTSGRLLGSLADSGASLYSAEQSNPGTAASASASCWFDSTDHSGLECTANGSANVFKMTKSGVDVNAVTGQVVGMSGVPICTTFTPTNGQAFTYTTGGSPSPCWGPTTIAGGGGSFAGLSDAIASAKVMGTNGSKVPVAASAADVGSIFTGTGGGTANAQTVTLSPAIASNTGTTIRWIPSAGNTAAATITVAGITAVNLTKCGTTALASGDLTTTAIAYAAFDGAGYQLLNPQAVSCAGASGTSFAALTGGTSPASTIYTLGAGSTMTPGGGSINANVINGQNVDQMTTKGDVYAANGSIQIKRLGVGTNGQTLTADSSQATGLGWHSFPEVFIVPSANCVSSTAGAGWDTTLTPACTAGTNNKGGTLPFVDASSAQFGFQLPGDWDATTPIPPYIKIVFDSASNTTGTVIFQVATACSKEDGSITSDPAFTSADTLVTKTMAAASREWSTTAQMSQVTGANNCVPGGAMRVQITRATDTAGAAVNVKRAVITVSRLLTTGQAN